MSLNNRTREQLQWAKVHAVAICFFVLFYAFRDINIYLWDTINSGYVKIALIMFIGFYFYFVRLGYEKESKLLVGYCAALYITRLLNGDIWLANDLYIVIEALFLVGVFETALLLNKEQRKKLLLVISIAMSIYFTVISAVCIYGKIFGVSVINPLCPDFFIVYLGSDTRIDLFGQGPNTPAAWFFIAFWLIMYLFFMFKKPAARVLIIFAAALNYVTIVLTYCRNVILASAVCIPLLIVWFIIKSPKLMSVKNKVICSCVVVCLLMPTIFVGSELLNEGFSSVSEIVSANEKLSEKAASSSGTEELNEVSNEETINLRGLQDSGRIPIYIASLKALVLNPEKLLTGRLSNEVIADVDALLPESFFVGTKSADHTHNMLLDVALKTGIFGLAAVVAFLVCLLVRMLKLYFNKNTFNKPELIPLVLLLAGLMMYNMFECSLFTSSDIRSFVFMLVAGAVVAYEKEQKECV